MRTIQFIGVSTAGSLIHEVFPRWARVLGVEAAIVGVDVPRDAPPERYRELLGAIRDDQDCLGAVITSHKTAVFRAAGDQFASLDPLAVACREINSIRNDSGRLHGYARDPISVGRVVDEIWPERDADLLCIGSGGTAIALARHLLERGQRGRLRFVDRDPAQAEHFAEVVADGRIEVAALQGPYDALVAAVRPGTFIVNATGAGKDREGSPVTDAVRFPPGSVFWDLNYRGDLRMLAAARAQAARQAVTAQPEGAALRVHDGTSLFCNGWASALTAVLDLPEDPPPADAFAAEMP
jgi:shikimate dehydrogenase